MNVDGSPQQYGRFDLELRQATAASTNEELTGILNDIYEVCMARSHRQDKAGKAEKFPRNIPGPGIQ